MHLSGPTTWRRGASQDVSGQRLAERLQIAGVSAAFFLAYALHANGPINLDVAWFLLVAKGVLNGATLYRDYFEPNAPLASLGLVPPVLAAEWFHVSYGQAVTVYVLGWAFACYALTTRLLERFDLPRHLSRNYKIALVCGCCLLPAYAFSQREHLIAILLEPYMLTAALRANNTRAPRGLSLAAGIAAGCAVALKPPFVLLPAIIEIIVFGTTRSISRWLGADLVAVVGVLLSYVVLIFFAFPGYFHVNSWALYLYDGYNWPTSILPPAIIWGIGTAAILLNPPIGGGARQNLRRVLSAATLASFVVYRGQGKGWSYQQLPFDFFLILLLSLGPFGVKQAWQRWFGHAALLLVFGTSFILLAARAPSPETVAAVKRRVAAEPGSFYIASTNVWPGPFLALDTGRVWASRYPCLIMLPGLLRHSGEARSAAFEQEFRHAIAADMSRFRPGLVLFPLKQDQSLPDGFDTLAWLLRDPAFTAEWNHYRRAETIDDYAVYERTPEL